MTNRMNRGFPNDFPYQKYQDYRLDGFSKKNSGRFSEAKDSFIMQLKLLQSEENRIDRSINKGGTYFDLGLCMALQGKNGKAIISFLKAYVKDALCTEIDKEDYACKGAAFNILKDYFGVKSHVISKIDEKVLSIKRQGEDIKNPETILEQVANELKINVDTISDWVKFHYIRLLNKSYFGFPQPWEYRIFVGGAYALNESISALYQIQDAVRRKGPLKTS